MSFQVRSRGHQGAYDNIGVVGSGMGDQDQQQQQGPEAQAIGSRRPVVLPESFNGEGDWSDWIEHFESVAAVNRWTEEEKLLWLRVRLVGRAATAFKRVDEDAKRSYGDSIAALKERFDPGSKRELYLAELLARKKRPREEWAAFAEDLKRLVERAYPELQDNAREQIALTHYLGQLDQPQLAFSVKQRRPKAVDEAVRTTLEMESYLSAPTLTVLPPLNEKHQEDSQSGIAAVGKKPLPPSIAPMLEQILDRLDKLETRLDRLASEQTANVSTSPTPAADKLDRPRTSRGPIKCHRCGKPGHLAKGCLAPKPQQRYSTGNDKPSM